MATKTEEGTDIKGELDLQRRNLIELLNKIGLIGVCFFAVAGFLFTCLWHGMDDTLTLVWGSFGLHILLMSMAFLLLGPMAAIVYRLLVDQFNVRRKIALQVHAWLQVASTIIGILGVRMVWIAHSSSYHFKSSHSIMGVFSLGIYVAQLVAALYIFFLGSKSLRASYRQLHMAVGQGLIVVMVYVASLGMMYYESEAYNLDWDDVGVNGYYRPYMTVAQYCIVFTMFSLLLVFYSQILA